MPIIKSAKKKVLQDKKKTIFNKKYITAIDAITRKLKTSKGPKTKELVKKLYSAVDKAVKKKIIHKKKASRMKSNYAKLLSNKSKSSQ